MYILTIPSFTWIKVDKTGKNQPSPRAGHTCNIRDGQIVVTGGFIGIGAPCDSPGIYVFDATRLEWTDRFNARAPRPDLHPENSVMAGSSGYLVPDKVVSVIGGGPSGSATATAPASRATDGPFATGRSPVFTVTTTGGSTVTQTAWGAGRTGAPPAPPADGSGNGAGEKKPAPGLVAAAVLAGLAGLLALYLGFCAWLYRRQVRAYRTHLAVANRYSGAAHASHASLGGIAAAFFGGRKASKESKDGGPGRKGRWAGSSRRNDKTSTSADAPAAATLVAGGRYGVLGTDSGDEKSDTAAGSAEPKRPAVVPGDGFGWVVSGLDSLGRRAKANAVAAPAWMSGGDEPTPGSGTTAAAAGGASSSSRPSPFEYSGGSGSASVPARSRTSGSDASSTEGLLEGQDLSFFSVVMAPRRALRVVNGLEDVEREQHVDEG